ncbi:MAG: hypothetical protein HW421_723 [Ignavibacteria bacterium]|nr:hypothetical protein [Ignavibacteria bacterium]
MFYEKIPDKVLRFGDVVRGFILTNPTIKEPILPNKGINHNYKIDIEHPNFSVILTPCCSIGDGMITISPLIQIRSDFFKNSYFVKDFTNINRKMSSEQAITTEEWNNFSIDEKIKRNEEGITFALRNLFIYQDNEIFHEYTLRGRDIKYYMIDFRNSYKINCDKIKRPEKLKTVDGIVMESKVLQLSIDARKELREKIADYYSRIPIEDKILED